MRFEMESMSEPPLISAKENWKPRRWAVVGASGFIGRNILHHLETEGIEVIGIAAPRVTFDLVPDPVHEIIKVSQTHPAVEKLVTEFEGIDVVINAAGAASPGGKGGNYIYGANSLLPAIIALASAKAGVGRMIHLSSAAVQGRTMVLDSSTKVFPFSYYSHSKALGERAILTILKSLENSDISIIRATSVQGEGRPTTVQLKRVAQSRFSSVAFPGSQPSAISSVTTLCDFIQLVGAYEGKMAVIQLQPWEGLNVREVLILSGSREPVVLPRFLCRFLVAAGHFVGRGVPTVAGVIRRVEMMWFGQELKATEHQIQFKPKRDAIESILRARVSEN